MSDHRDRTIAMLREQIEERDETIRQLRAELSHEGALPDWLPRLTKLEDAVFRRLLKRGRISRDELANLMNEEVSSPYNQGSVYIHRLRRKLDPVGVKIVTDWWRGYYLDDASVDRLRSVG